MTIKWHLRELMNEARLTYKELNTSSGVSTEIITRLINEPDAAASSKTVDRLLEALQPHIKRPLTTNDLQEWVSAVPTATELTQVSADLAALCVEREQRAMRLRHEASKRNEAERQAWLDGEAVATPSSEAPTDRLRQQQRSALATDPSAAAAQEPPHALNINAWEFTHDPAAPVEQIRHTQRKLLLPKDAPTDPTLTPAEAERRAALLRQANERRGG